MIYYCAKVLLNYNSNFILFNPFLIEHQAKFNQVLEFRFEIQFFIKSTQSKTRGEKCRYFGVATIIRFNKKCSCHGVPMMKSRMANELFSSFHQCLDNATLVSLIIKSCTSNYLQNYLQKITFTYFSLHEIKDEKKSQKTTFKT